MTSDVMASSLIENSAIESFSPNEPVAIEEKKSLIKLS